MGRLVGQVAIVTGAGTGIGKEAAKMLASEGAKVVVVGRRPEPLAGVVDQIKSAGGDAAACKCDLTDGSLIEGVRDFTLTTYGRIDILVNNAGFSSRVRSVKYSGGPGLNGPRLRVGDLRCLSVVLNACVEMAGELTCRP